MSSQGMGGVCLLSVCWLSGASHLSAHRLELRARRNPSVNNRTSCQIHTFAHTHTQTQQSSRPTKSFNISPNTTCSFSADHRMALWHLANLRRSGCNRHSFHVMTDKVILDYMLKKHWGAFVIAMWDRHCMNLTGAIAEMTADAETSIWCKWCSTNSVQYMC